MKALQHPYRPLYPAFKKPGLLLNRFWSWCKSQEEYRLGWLAVIITAHGCFITPITLFFVLTNGNNPVLWGLAIAAIGMSLVTNLAALPAKFTIPVFLFSIIIDVFVIANCIIIN